MRDISVVLINSNLKLTFIIMSEYSDFQEEVDSN